MNAQNNNVEIREGEKVREYTQERKGLFGLISYQVVARTETIGRSVRISIPNLTNEDTVIINGREWKPIN